jgi:hypothetical protein
MSLTITYLITDIIRLGITSKSHERTFKTRVPSAMLPTRDSRFASSASPRGIRYASRGVYLDELGIAVARQGGLRARLRPMGQPCDLRTAGEVNSTSGCEASVSRGLRGTMVGTAGESQKRQPHGGTRHAHARTQAPLPVSGVLDGTTVQRFFAGTVHPKALSCGG